MKKILLLLLITAGFVQAQQSIPAIRGEVNTYFPTNNAKQIQAVKLRETFNDVLDHVDTLNKKKYGKTIAQIRLINNANYEIAFVLDSAKQGWFYYDSADIVTADDNNNTIVAANGRRYKRSIILAPVVSVNGKTGVVVLNKDDIFGLDSLETNDIANDAVTYAKMQNISATNRLLGRSTAGAGDIEEITVGGDITQSGSGFTISANAVTLAKMSTISTASLLGRSTAGTGNVEELSAATARTLLNVANGATANSSDATLLARANHTGTQTASTISDFSSAVAATAAVTANTAKVTNATHTGDVTGSTVLSIAANAVVDADIRQSSGLSVIGRSANTTGNVADITAANDGEILRRSGTAIGFGTIATAGIADAAVTYAKMQNISATNRLLGRSTAGAGVTEEVTASGVLDWIGATRGQILFRGASGWSALSPGTAGQVLSTGGAGADPSWATAAGSPFASDIVVNSISIGRGAGNIATNVRMGVSALSSNTTGNQNVAIGEGSMLSNVSGANNTAVGYYALKLATASRNTGVGTNAIYRATGSDNTAVGHQSLGLNTSGTQNTAVGVGALYNNLTNQSSTAIGYNTLYNSTGGFNTAVGETAGYNVTTGVANTFLGQYTGIGITTGGYNTIIGANVTGLSSSLSNYMILADGQGNRRINIPSTGNVLIATTTDSGYKLDVSGTARATQFFLSALNTAPASAGAAGVTGEIRIDASHIYICTATNTWKRIAIATW